MRVVIELKRGEIPDIILNNLYKMTQLQDTFGMNMVALVDGQPRLLNLKQMLECFLAHRREVVTRRTVFELRKARDRGHILEGLAVALSNVDEIIALIKAAPTPSDAKVGLMSRTWPSPLVSDMLKRAAAEASRPENIAPEFGMTAKGYRLSDVQAQAILELRLQRLTGLEQDKIVNEYRDVMEKIADLLDILAKPARITEIIGHDLNDVREQFVVATKDKRRSEIVTHTQDLGVEDLIAPQDMVVTLSHTGYIKSQPLTDYRAQRRGGRGKHIVNMFPLDEGEKINAILPVKEFAEDRYVFMATSLGTVKKTPLSDFSNPRKAGIIAVALDEGDYLIGAQLTSGGNDIMLVSDAGKAVWFDEEDVRPMGRPARGVRGMKLQKDQTVLSLLVAQDDAQTVLVATENGFGKRTALADFRHSGRGTQGGKAIADSARNGKVVAAKLVGDEDEIMLITTGGVLIRTRVKEIRELGRATQGVTLISLDDGEKLAGLEKIVETDDEE